MSLWPEEGIGASDNMVDIYIEEEERGGKPVTNWWNNTETWETREGEVMRLEDMAPGHRANLIRWIHRRGRRIRNALELEYMAGALLMNGEAASDSLEQMAHEVSRTPIDELVESLPLVKRLRELNNPLHQPKSPTRRTPVTTTVETYITFGVQYKENPDPRYPEETHPLGMHSEGYAVIEAPSRDKARDIAFAIFGQQWAFDYDTPPSEDHAPAGEILRIAWLDRDTLSQARGAIEEAEASEESSSFDDVFDARNALADVVRGIIKGARQ